MCIHDLKPRVSLSAKTDMFPLFQTAEIKQIFDGNMKKKKLNKYK